MYSVANMKKKPKVNIEEKTEKVANLVKTLFKEIENIAHFKINSIVDKDELDKLYIKVETKKDMYFELSLFNSATNSLVTKPYEIISFMTLCKLNMVYTTITMDIEKLYKESMLKAYDEITEIFLD